MLWLHQQIVLELKSHLSMIRTAGREPPDPRKGFNPTSFCNHDNRTHRVPPVCGSRRCHEERIMKKNLPARPNLDHLRRQAKALLAALESRDADAASTILNHLPAAKGMTKPRRRHGIQ